MQMNHVMIEMYTISSCSTALSTTSFKTQSIGWSSELYLQEKL